MTFLSHYLTTFTALRGSTVPETSYYGVLQTLLNAVGETLRPKVSAVIHPKDSGAGIPDLALFDDHQPTDQKPAHGIIEAKPISSDVLAIARSEQVRRYVLHYGQALVTNYYQFVLVTRGEEGEAVIEERYSLAENEAAFWATAAQPTTLAKAHEAALTEFLLRVMRRNAALTTPQDVAWILASYAREAKARIEVSGTDLTALNKIRQQLEAALGVRFEDETAEEFFRSTLVQTLFYGLFSAWVLWHEKNPTTKTKFDLWRDTRRLNIPVISELFEQFSSGTVLPLSIEQILEWTTDALNRVDRAVFFATFNKGATVQYFYEPFLEAFDPELRRQLGVWYTPPEVVDYMVARVDSALKTELGIADGLANRSVYVLDPCCGTGAYLVAVLRHIYGTLQVREGDALAGQAVQQAMRERVIGFEILPAPFVVAHLQIGMLLNTLHAPLNMGQRAGVYLTNALTGWEVGSAPKPLLLFPELQKERDAADDVKHSRPILVILGNPPYSGFAGVAVEEERDLTNAYRTTQNPNLPRPQGQGLNDLYVRFFRMAERQIVERTQTGIVSFISNYSWLDGLSHPGMRERYLEAFDKIYVDNLHGDRIISEYAPDGRTSETVFAMRGSSSGIKVGTAIATLIRKPAVVPTPSISLPINGEGEAKNRATLYYHDWHQARAEERRQALLDSVKSAAAFDGYITVEPAVEIGLPFKPRVVGADYFAWTLLPELFPTYFAGVKTSRDDVVVSVDKDRLIENVQLYLKTTPSRVYDANKLVRYAYRPFDVRWLYWDEDILDRARPEYFPHVKPDNLWMVSQQKVRREWSRPQVLSSLADMAIMDRAASIIPLYLYDVPKAQLGLFETHQVSLGKRKANLSAMATDYLTGLDLSPEAGAELLFYHVLAVLHSPRYRVENAGALRQDWPRLPLPKLREMLESSAAVGRQVAALLDVETPVSGVTVGDPREDLAGVAVLTTVEGNSVPDFTVNAGWGHFGSGSAVMPGRGRINPTPQPPPHSQARGEGESDVSAGELPEARQTIESHSVDVYLNDTTYWRNVPLPVWDYTLGGYQVLKKWLSYRETSVLGRPLKPEEAREFMQIARRITALVGLQSALDTNYQAVVSTA